MGISRLACEAGTFYHVGLLGAVQVAALHLPAQHERGLALDGVGARACGDDDGVGEVQGGGSLRLKLVMTHLFNPRGRNPAGARCARLAEGQVSSFSDCGTSNSGVIQGTGPASLLLHLEWSARAFVSSHTSPTGSESAGPLCGAGAPRLRWGIGALYGRARTLVMIPQPGLWAGRQNSVSGPQ